MSRKKRHASGKMINNFFGMEFDVQEKIPSASHRVAFSITPSLHFCLSICSFRHALAQRTSFFPCAPHPHEHWLLCWSLLSARSSMRARAILYIALHRDEERSWSVGATQESRHIEHRSAGDAALYGFRKKMKIGVDDGPVAASIGTKVHDGMPFGAPRCFPINWQTAIVFLRRVDIS
jgi:hypothetical protein